MEKLVDRLRGFYELGPNGEFGTRDFSNFIPPISLEAADEIESLQDQLDTARGEVERYKAGVKAIKEMATDLRWSEHIRLGMNKALGLLHTGNTGNE